MDDEEALCNLSKIILVEMGYRVTAERDSEKALHTFERDPNKYSLVISDYSMPKLNGPKLIKKVKAIRPEIPIILLTGFANLATQENLATWQCDGFIAKPYNMKRLGEAVNNAIAK